MDIENGVERLSAFARELAEDGVRNSQSFRAWCRKHESIVENVLDYEPARKKPHASALLDPQFINELGLIGFNYSRAAHGSLHGSLADGWTDPLRLCRGILFDHAGRLVALPFPKFFNDREHPETRRLPRGAFTAWKKMDGHLGIIFSHAHRLELTTRGRYTSPSAVLGRDLLARFGESHRWDVSYPTDLTILVEIIAPSTRVHVDYGSRKGFTLLGAYDRSTFRELDSVEIEALGRELRLPLPDRWPGTSILELRREMKRRDVENEEGYVARFDTGLRVKFKYVNYIGRMVGAKLTYAYVMKRIMAGNLRRMISTLPEEGLLLAREMAARVRRIHRSDKTPREKRARLYALVPEGLRTSTFKTACGAFLRSNLP